MHKEYLETRVVLRQLTKFLSAGVLRYAGLLILGMVAAPVFAESPSNQTSSTPASSSASSSSASDNVLVYGEPLPMAGLPINAATPRQQPVSSLTTTAEATGRITSIGVSQEASNPSLKPFSIEFTSLDVNYLQAQASAPVDTASRPTFVPRVFARYTNRGAGYIEGFTSVGAFVPLDLDSDLGLTFFEGQLNIQNNSALGANAIFGHRFYDKALDSVYGGYVAYDFRNTGRSSFSQIGVGLEFLSSGFDARINGYFPIGAIRNQVASGTSTSSFGFSGNQLVLSGSGFRQFETAATVVDAEVGREIVPIGDRGSLRAYAGTYLISAQGSPTVVGVKGRIEALPTDFLNVGVSVQNDSLFDTRVVFTVGASFPGSSPQGVSVPQSSALNRLGESVGRQSAILVADPTVTGQTENFTASEVATDPSGRPYRFLHVRQGAAGSNNGTNENPFTSVQTALNNDASGDIVYVRGSGVENFNPELTPGVQLLFSRIEQRLPLLGGGTVVLPGSPNTADIYTINATGTLDVGSNSRVSGLTITPTAGLPGITATGVSNITIDNNTITTTGAPGIDLQNVTGGVAVITNTVVSSGTGINAVVLSNSSGNVNLNLSGNTATGGNNGVLVNLSGTATGSGTISNNVTNNSTNSGIFVRSEGTSNINLTIANNTIRNNGSGGSVAPGIGVEARGASQARIVLDSNIVTNNADGGVALFVQDTATLFTQVRLNTITGNSALLQDFSGNVFSTGSRLCIQPNNNTIATFVRNNVGGGTFQIEGALPGTNTITTTPAPTGTITTVATGTCGF